MDNDKKSFSRNIVRTSDKEDGDFFPTEPKFTHLMLDQFRFSGEIWEPACGDGAISEVLKSRGYKVHSSDLFDRGYGRTGVDFLKAKNAKAPNIITNPPFALFDKFFSQSWALAKRKVCFVVALPYLSSSITRYENLWKPYQPNNILLVVNKMKVHNKPSIFSHVWVLWDKNKRRDVKTEFTWTFAEKGYSR